MRLSVAMCTYNGAQYVEKQLLSILQQDLKVNEIVVCDDGSIDETLMVVHRIANSHPEVVWKIHKNPSNLGVIGNFEKAIRLCSGDIIFLSDQDDVWHRDKTKVICDYFEANPSKDVLFSDAIIVGGKGESLISQTLLDVWGLKPCMGLWNSGLDFEMLNQQNCATGATMAFRKEARNRFLPFDRSSNWILHDWQIAMSACLNNSLAVLNECLMDYRVYAENAVGLGDRKGVLFGEKVSDRYPGFIELKQLNPYFRKFHTEKIAFYEQRRFLWYTTKVKKIRFLFYIRSYRHRYRSRWMLVYVADLLYRLNEKLRNRFFDYYKAHYLS